MLFYEQMATLIEIIQRTWHSEGIAWRQETIAAAVCVESVVRVVDVFFAEETRVHTHA